MKALALDNYRRRFRRLKQGYEMKIGKKLAVMIISLNLIGSGVLVGTILNISKSEISELITNEVINQAQESALEIAIWFDKYMDAARTGAQFMERYKEINLARRRPIYNLFIRSIVESNPEIAAAGSCWEPNALDGLDAQYTGAEGSDKTGRFIPYWSRSGSGVLLESLTDYEIPGKGDYYILAKRTGNETLIEPYWYTIDGTKRFITSLSAPVKVNNKFLGAVIIDIDISIIQKKTLQIKPYEGSIAAVFSNSGIVTAHYDRERIGKNMAQTEISTAGAHLPELMEAIRNGKQYTFKNKFAGFAGNEEFQFFAVPFTVGNTTTPWGLLVGIPAKIINEPIYRMLIISAIICAVMLILVALGAVFMARSISSPLGSVVNVLKSVGEGDLTKHLDIKKRSDEIGTMTDSFNGTIANIHNLVLTIKDKSSSLLAIGTELSANMTQTAAAVNEITANIKGMKSQAVRQSEGVNNSAIAMDKIILCINKLNTEIDRQSDSVSQSSSAIEEMLANIQSVTQTLVNNEDSVKDLSEAAEIGRSGLQQVSADIREIARESEGLLEINSVIENIASQTNLLSMNAAIEAAHAGEAGRGFAVVADEIRKLAESSSVQSKTISAVLKKITDSIGLITKSTDAVLKKFEAIDTGVKTVFTQEENIRRAMEEQSAGSQQILEAISRLTDISGQVKIDAEAMLTSSGDVIDASKTLEAITEELSNGMREMDIGADQINIAVNRVNEISVGNKNDIDGLITEVNKFKI
ncbi:MAG: methyl-accepting chemotaxis protein [Spirochaetaceae bacterium]|nr:methyl-accepting chemotaxis protein [Spirochaetaceae bacterium]